jgi:uncharacterized protein YaaW (UPF0174 family)
MTVAPALLAMALALAAAAPAMGLFIPAMTAVARLRDGAETEAAFKTAEERGVVDA